MSSALGAVDLMLAAHVPSEVPEHFIEMTDPKCPPEEALSLQSGESCSDSGLSGSPLSSSCQTRELLLQLLDTQGRDETADCNSAMPSKSETSSSEEAVLGSLDSKSIDSPPRYVRLSRTLLGYKYGYLGRQHSPFRFRDTMLQHEPSADDKEGRVYLRRLEQETQWLSDRIQDFEMDLSRPNLPEQAAEQVRSVVGQARLITTQKCKQLEQLCQKNLKPECGEPTPTGQDLAGFWDLLSLQLNALKEAFAGLKAWRDQGWSVKERNDALPPTSAKKQIKPRSAPPRSDKVRCLDEERRKLLRQKREALRNGAANGSTEVQIFVPESL